jgi:hypothetical protein
MAYVADAVTLWRCLQQCVLTGLNWRHQPWLHRIQCGFNCCAEHLVGTRATWRTSYANCARKIWLCVTYAPDSRRMHVTSANPTQMLRAPAAQQGMLLLDPLSSSCKLKLSPDLDVPSMCSFAIMEITTKWKIRNQSTSLLLMLEISWKVLISACFVRKLRPLYFWLIPSGSELDWL